MKTMAPDDKEQAGGDRRERDRGVSDAAGPTWGKVVHGQRSTAKIFKKSELTP